MPVVAAPRSRCAGVALLTVGVGVGGVGVVPAAIMVRVRIGKAVIGVG